MQSLFNEYKNGILFHFPKEWGNLKTAFAWTKEVNLKLLSWREKFSFPATTSPFYYSWTHATSVNHAQGRERNVWI